MRIRRDALDKLFSQLVRARAGWRCECCGAMPHKGGLDAAHVLSRRHALTRFDLLNALSVCKGCHRYYTERPFEWVDWCNSNLGGDRVRELRERANARDKLTDADKRAIGEDMIAAIKELGEVPVCGLGRRLSRKKKAAKKRPVNRGNLKRKVSGEVVKR